MEIHGANVSFFLPIPTLYMHALMSGTLFPALACKCVLDYEQHLAYYLSVSHMSLANHSVQLAHNATSGAHDAAASACRQAEINICAMPVLGYPT